MFTSFICIKKNRKGKMKKIIKTAAFGVVATGIASALLPVSAEGVTRNKSELCRQQERCYIEVF